MPAPVWAQVENVSVLEEAAIGTLRRIASLPTRNYKLMPAASHGRGHRALPKWAEPCVDRTGDAKGGPRGGAGGPAADGAAASRKPQSTSASQLSGKARRNSKAASSAAAVSWRAARLGKLSRSRTGRSSPIRNGKHHRLIPIRAAIDSDVMRRGAATADLVTV